MGYFIATIISILFFVSGMLFVYGVTLIVAAEARQSDALEARSRGGSSQAAPAGNTDEAVAA